MICDFLLLAAFVDEVKQIDVELVHEAVSELKVEEIAMPKEEAAQARNQNAVLMAPHLEERLARMEDQYAMLNSLHPERAKLLERVTSQGRLLEYLINIQQSQFRRIGENLEVISGKVNKIFPTAEGGLINFDSRRKR